MCSAFFSSIILMLHGYKDLSDIAVPSFFPKQEFILHRYILGALFLNFSVHNSFKPGSFSSCKVKYACFPCSYHLSEAGYCKRGLRR